MKKLIEIKEYDILTCNKAFKDEYVYLDNDSFEQLENMILNCNDMEDVDAYDFSLFPQSGMLERSFVQKLCWDCAIENGTQIQILPKIYGKTAIDPKTF